MLLHPSKFIVYFLQDVVLGCYLARRAGDLDVARRLRVARRDGDGARDVRFGAALEVVAVGEVVAALL